MKRTEGKERNGKGLGVRESVKYLRTRLGTYSNDLFTKDIAEIIADETPPNAIRDITKRYRGKPAQYGVTPDILDTIIARKLTTAPEGFIAQDQLRINAGVAWDLLKEIVKTFIRMKGYSEDVLADVNAWRKNEEQLAPFFVHARSAGNGYTSIFFSPEAQKEIIRMAEEKKRSVHEPKSQTVLPKARTPLQGLKSEHPRTHEQGIIDLKRRIAAILPNLLPHEQRRAEEINSLLSPTTLPENAEHFGQEIRKLEAAARRNRQDE